MMKDSFETCRYITRNNGKHGTGRSTIWYLKTNQKTIVHDWTAQIITSR